MDDNLSILDGIAGMDGEHKVQMTMIMALEQGLALGRPRSALAPILEQLLAYSDLHFRSEQMLMTLYDYPDRQGHETVHEALLAQAGRVARDFSAEEISSVSSELLSLRRQLVDHIRIDDHAFHQFLDRRSVETESQLM